MPIREYECPLCKRRQELLVLSSEKLEAPFCFCKDGEPVEMVSVISASSFVLKGSCWGRDGYANDPMKGYKVRE